MAQGFIYLVAVIDWFSRYILSWRISISLEADFCIEALKDAIEQYGQPEIFNTDQGSQFTSRDFIAVLEQHKIKISMDGKGRALDNVFIERFWRSLKQEKIYMIILNTVKEAKSAITNYMGFYNNKRMHQALEYLTPKQVHFKKNIV
jgi:putative transposase